MGYDLKIGKLVANADDWKEVEGESHPDAPNFPGDDTTKNTNYRGISYTSMHDFCKSVGLFPFFYDNQGRSLRGGHPGHFKIDKSDLELVKSVRERFYMTLPKGSVPGWPDDVPNGNYDLCRFDWLIWWMEYAIDKYGKDAAIANT